MATPVRVAARRIVVNDAKFRLAKADTPELVLNQKPTDGVVTSGAVLAVTCKQCTKTTDVYFVGGSSVETGSGVGKAQISSTYYRFMKAPANNLCTFRVDFLQWDCKTSYIDPTVVRLVVETALTDERTWGTVEYNMCQNAYSSLKATSVETTCDGFAFNPSRQQRSH